MWPSVHLTPAAPLVTLTAIMLTQMFIMASTTDAVIGLQDTVLIAALVGDSVTMPCEASNSSCGRVHSIKWYKSEQRVYLFSDAAKIDRAEGDLASPSSRATFLRNATPPHLHITHTDVGDDGAYRCEVTYLRVQDSCPTVAVFKLTVLDSPSSFEVSSNNFRLKNGTTLGPYDEGESVNLTCVAKGGKPAAKLSWWHNQNQLAASNEEIAKGDGRWTTISITGVTLDRHTMASPIECRLEHESLDGIVIASVNLDVHVRPTLLDLKSSHQQAVIAGTVVSLVCSANGSRPPTNITWLNGTTIPFGRRVSFQSETVSSDVVGTSLTEAMIVFNASRYDHARNFSCRAINSPMARMGEEPLLRTFILEVLYAPVVNVLPSGNLTVKEQSSVTLSCAYDANPVTITRVMWLKDGVTIIPAFRHRVDFGADGVPRLVIRNVTHADQGSYTCVLENSVGTGYTNDTANLGIQHPPDVVITVTPSVVNETDSEEVKILCKVARANPRHLDRVKWYKDGKLMNETSEGELTIRRVDRSQHGDFSCKAKNVAGWGVLSDAKNLVVHYPPGRAVLSYTPTVVLKRDKLMLLCSVEDPGRPPITHYRWMRGKRLFKEVTSGNWTIEPVKLTTEGNFTCVGVNAVGEGISASIHIDVHAPPAFIDRLQHYEGVPLTTTSFWLECRVECDPPCKIQWLRNDDVIVNSDRYTITSRVVPPDPGADDFQSVASTLSLNMSAWPGGKLDRLHDNANYTCRSTDNSAGPGVSSTTYFRVEYPPENVSVSAPVLDVIEGEGVAAIRCKAFAYPDSTYIWFLGNRTVAKGEILSLPGAMNRERGGLYTCVASNRLGSATVTTLINVLYKPECRLIHQGISRGRVLLSCQAEGNPQLIHFTWSLENNTLKDASVQVKDSESVLTIPNSNTHSGTYFCIANNSIGVSSYCSLDIAGWTPAESQSWLDRLGDDNLLMMSVVGGGVAVLVCVACCVVFLVARRRKAKAKYDAVELEEREKFLSRSPEGMSQLADGPGSGEVISRSDDQTGTIKCNGTDVTSGHSSMVVQYRPLCPTALLVSGPGAVPIREATGKNLTYSVFAMEQDSSPNRKIPLRTKPDGSQYLNLPVVLDPNHKVNISAWCCESGHVKVRQ